jgi:hypothetical protein
MAHVLDDERALPRIQRIVTEILLLLDENRILDAARSQILNGLVKREGDRLLFRFDMEKGRPNRGPFYVLGAKSLRLAKDKDFRTEPVIWLEELTAKDLLFGLQTLWREELVRKVMES